MVSERLVLVVAFLIEGVHEREVTLGAKVIYTKGAIARYEPVRMQVSRGRSTDTHTHTLQHIP